MTARNMHSKPSQANRNTPGFALLRGLADCLRFCFLILWFGWHLPARADTGPLRTLTTAHAAHSLAQNEASRAYPVRLRAVVTFYDEYLDSTGTPVLFVADSSGSVYAALKPKPAVSPKPGDLVEVTGVTGAGLFAPIVDLARVRILGSARLPPSPPRVILGDMLKGRYEGQWVEIEGMVEAVRNSGTHIVLDILLRDGTTTAITARQPNIDYSQLVDSEIILHGNASPNFNKQKQVTGAHLLFPGLGAVKVVKTGSLNPFHLPLSRISDLLRFDPNRSFPHIVHIRGDLTLLWPGRMICVQDRIQDDLQGLCARTQQVFPHELGDVVDVIGFPLIGPFTPTLEDADYRGAAGNRFPEGVRVTASEALRGDYDAHLVTLEGRTIDDNRNGSDRIITLSSGGIIFTITMPQASPLSSSAVGNHSLVRITGICSVQSGGTKLGTGEGFSIPQSFSILARSTSDLTVLERPSWWNAAHTLAVLAIALAVTLAAFGWLVVLRRRVKEQTATIRSQLAETNALKEAAEFQATHDGLTGLYNRKAILDLLRREAEMAARSGAPTGIIMLDLDHFKRINDTYGHAAGDDVLCEAVRRILPAVRSSDWVGRYGGEEFIIVLPNTGDKGVCASAERVRRAIGDGVIAAQNNPIQVTASLGATAASFSFHTAHEAVVAADLALYDAKNSGRNQVCFRDLGHQPRPMAASSRGDAVGRSQSG